MRDRLDESALVLQQLVDASDAGIPKELVETAEGIAGIAVSRKCRSVSVDVMDAALRFVAKMEARARGVPQP